MKRALPLVLALLLLGSGSLFAQGERLVSLAHKFPPNQTVRYKIVQHITGTRTFPGSEKPVPIEAQVTSKVRMRCDQVSEDGTATISTEIESATIKTGKHETNAFSAGNNPRTLQVTPSGKVIFPPQEEQVQDNSTRRALMDSGAITPLIILASLPEQPIAVGGSWSADVLLPSATAIKVASTFQEVKDISGERRATIKQTQTTADDSPNKQEAQSALVFGINAGRLLSAEGTVHSVVNTWTLDSKFSVQMLKE
ncbi:MAG TPA: hypothetical protein VFI02_03120 [Armatimonadota bacterium]|nr:hypothetical protein [Armatimonadota bacterium]